MARKPSRQPVPDFAAFAALLDGHLRNGMRSGQRSAKPWTDVEFAGRIPGRDADSDGSSANRVANWRHGIALPHPDSIEKILRALFGPDGANTDRQAMADAYLTAHSAKSRAVVRAAPKPADAVEFLPAGPHMAIVAGTADDTAVAAKPATARGQERVRERLEELLRIAGARLDNQPTFSLLPQRARRARDAASGPVEELPGHLDELYDYSSSLAGFIDYDNRLHGDVSANEAPLDADIRRALEECVSTFALWLRGFPRIRAADTERSDLIGRRELYAALVPSLDSAREFIAAAAATDVLSGADTQRVLLPLETARGSGDAAEKAGYRGLANARRLLTQAIAFASDPATDIALAGNLGALLADAEAQSRQLAQGLLPDLRHAVEFLLTENLNRRRNREQAVAGRRRGTAAPGHWPPRAPFTRWRDTHPDLPAAALPEMMTLPGGRFLMGSPKTEAERFDDEGPQHAVTVPPFALGLHAVTFAQWDAALAQGADLFQPDDAGWGRGDRPVINVSWKDAMAYCAWLNGRGGLDAARGYRLPTEAEWEYACRAGTATPFSFGETISAVQANYGAAGTYHRGSRQRFRQRTVAVGSLPANPWGLHEMHGNVWEWVADTWHDNYDEAPDDGSAWVSDDDAASRVLRGGSWFDRPRFLRSAVRDQDDPDFRISFSGFRLARTL